MPVSFRRPARTGAVHPRANGLDIYARSRYGGRVTRPARRLAQVAHAAARGNLAAAAEALGCTVDELRDVLRIEETRGRPAKPIPSVEEARAVVERADPAEVKQVGVRALATALDVPLSTLRDRLAAARATDGRRGKATSARK